MILEYLKRILDLLPDWMQLCKTETYIQTSITNNIKSFQLLLGIIVIKIIKLWFYSWNKNILCALMYNKLILLERLKIIIWKIGHT